MSKALIIVTSTQSGNIYKEFRKKYSPSENNGVLKTTVNSNRIFVVNKHEIADPASSIKSIVNGLSSFEIFICAHAGYINADDFSEKVTEFGHTDDTGKELLKFAEKRVKFEQLWEYLEKKSHKNLTFLLLHLVLPLDIDMQAIQILKERRDKEHSKTPEEYFDELQNDGTNYLQKLSDLWWIIAGFDKTDYGSEFAELPSPSKESKDLVKDKSLSLVTSGTDLDMGLLKHLSGLTDECKPNKDSAVYKFFESLGTGEINDLYNPFNIKINNKDIISFHDWYCALAECLRGEDACKKN